MPKQVIKILLSDPSKVAVDHVPFLQATAEVVAADTTYAYFLTATNVRASAMPPTDREPFKGWPPLMPVYGSGGLMAAPKMWIGEVKTDASGNWTADISKAGFTAPPVSVQANAVSASANAADRANATVVTRTALAVGGTVTLPVTLLALGLTERKAGANVVVMLEVTGY